MNNRDMKQIFKYIEDAIRSGADLIRQKADERRGNPDIIDAPQPPAVYEEKPFQKIWGALLAVAGYTLGGSTLVTTMLLLLGASLANELGLGLGMAAFNSLFIAGFGAMAWKGTTTVTGTNRFRLYRKIIGDEELCNIRHLAEKIGKSERFVVKDVEKMIRKGWFCQGHLDKEKTCLMVTDHMYREYQKLEVEKEQLRIEEENRRLQKKKEEEQAAREAKEQKREAFWGKSKAQSKNLPPEVENILDQGAEYVKQIRQCNDAIPGEEISGKIDRMELILTRIFARVEQSPDCVADIKKLMDYYLPTTVKLLKTYTEMDAQPVDGANIQATKKEIEDTLDMINAAFEKLLDSLFQDAAWDVSSDISVLQTMLAQEGLTEDGLKK